MNGMRVLAAIAMVTWLAGGCGNRNKPSLEPTVQSNDGNAPRAEAEPGPRAREVRAELPAYQSAVAPLPMRNDEQNRKQIAQAFEAAGRLLSTLEGSQPTGAFRQQLRIIDTTRQRLASASQSLAIEPTINAGLRATYNALVGLRMNQFGNDADVADRIDTLRARIDDLDTVRGPMHRLVVAQAFRGAGDVVDAMAKSLETRAGNEQAPAQPPPDQQQQQQQQQPATAPPSGQ